MVNDKAICVRLPEAMLSALQRVADKDSRKPADVARLAIRDFLRSKGQDV